jgi:fatty acid desaturase
LSNTDQGAQPRLPFAGDDAAQRERAKRRVEAVKGFYIHLFIFVLVVAGLFVLNLAIGEPWWVLWIVLGWGIGVLAHRIAVMGRGSKALANWEKRKLEKFMAEDR